MKGAVAPHAVAHHAVARGRDEEIHGFAAELL